MRPPRPSGTPEQAGDRVGRHTGGPDHGAGRDAPPVSQHDCVGFDVVDADSDLDRDLPAPQRGGSLIRQRAMEGAEDTVCGLDERDGDERAVEIREILAEHLVDQFSQATGHLDAGRPAADDDDPEVDPAAGAGALEPAQQMGAQRQRVVQRLQREMCSGRPLRRRTRC